VLALDAAALTLGRARGAVLVGRPLELTIPATLDAAVTDPCANVDLFYGDQRVTRTPTVRWESRDGKEGVLRVTSEVAVDEPMVTMYLRIGCTQPSSRRYVLLAEVPPEEASVMPGRAAAASVVPPAPPPSAVAPPPASTSAPSTTSGRAATSARADPPAPAAALVAPATPPRAAERPPATARAAARPKVETARAPARPVLKLEPVDLSIDYAPTLRLSSEIGTQPTADPAARQAAAALWQALQKGPEEAMQEAQRVQAVQRELQAVRDLNRQTAADLAGMRVQVEQAQSQRSTASWLALVLAVLLAAMLAVIAWRWNRLRRIERVGRWFEANGKPTAVPPMAAMPPLTVPDIDIGQGAPPPATHGAVPVLVDNVPARRAPAVPMVAWSPSQQDFQASRGGTMRMVGVEELLDVHDKADFFLSIGEVEQAVSVLEGHVHDQVETSALPWMDLLELYHSLGRRRDFDRVSGEFRERFSAQVPDFEHFDQPTPTLENYGRALSRIVALWPNRRVLDVIEESIFRKPGLPGAEPFSLEAYRELVLLYHVAKDLAPVAEAPADEPRVTNFSETSLQPLHALDAPDRAAPDADLLLVPPASSNVGVDIDITAADDEVDTLPPLDFDIDSQEGELPDTAPGRA
jgi:hypothetical protein